ncbi:MAG TPA: sulfotransferase [Rhizomicrobium sp.]|nr:sulfotransferase [Rhizomicrobium sp.]
MPITLDKKDSASALSDEDEIVQAAAAALRDRRPLKDARLKEAATALQNGEHAAAERLLSAWLERRPDDSRALHLLGEATLKLGRKEEAETLLARCVAAAPDYDAGRFSYASTLYQRNRLDASLAELEKLLAAHRRNILFLDLKSAVLTAMGRHHDSMLCRRELAEAHPNSAELWIKYGKALRSIGERASAVDALRHAIALKPTSGNAWWTLADMKTWCFSDAEISAMESALGKADANDRMYLHFALGRAYGDRENFAKSFDNYARANAMKRLTVTYDADWLSAQIAKVKALFTRDFFETHGGDGHPSPEPIFVVGMQRAGSTLVEQILGSHSAIEATAELPDITLMAEQLAETGSPYPEAIATLDAAALRRLGERYLETTRFRRTRGAPHFVDKNPYNFLHIGLIRLILPNAKIVDVRRHPLACCWSNFCAHFEMGALFAYRFSELGRAYADYADAMAHFDATLPGSVHRLIYEDLIAYPEKEIRRLLEYLGLPFEETCLAFHANARAMNSVSSEQVRRPIYTDALEQWRNYEPWLGPLKSALGRVLEAWR